MALLALKVADYMEQKLEKLIQKTSTILPHVARACLCATFLEDTYRMATQWTEQRGYISGAWGVGPYVAHSFVAINLFGQVELNVELSKLTFYSFSVQSAF